MAATTSTSLHFRLHGKCMERWGIMKIITGKGDFMQLIFLHRVILETRVIAKSTEPTKSTSAFLKCY